MHQTYCLYCSMIVSFQFCISFYYFYQWWLHLHHQMLGMAMTWARDGLIAHQARAWIWNWKPKPETNEELDDKPELDEHLDWFYPMYWTYENIHKIFRSGVRLWTWALICPSPIPISNQAINECSSPIFWAGLFGQIAIPIKCHLSHPFRVDSLGYTLWNRNFIWICKMFTTGSLTSTPMKVLCHMMVGYQWQFPSSINKLVHACTVVFNSNLFTLCRSFKGI